MKNIKLMLIAFAAVLLMSSTTFAQRSGQNSARADRMVQVIKEKLDLSDEQATQIKTIHQEFSEKMRALRGASNGDRGAMTASVEKLNVEKDAAIEKVLNKEQMTKWEALKAERTARPKMERPQGKRPTMNTKGEQVKGVKRPTMDVKGERPEGKRSTMNTKGEQVKGVKRPAMDVKGERPEGKRPAMNTKGEQVKGVKRPQVERPQGKRPTTNTKVERPQKPMGKRVNKMQQELGLSASQATELKKITKEHLAKVKELKASGARKGKIKRAFKKHKSAVKKLLTPEQFEKWIALKAEKKVKRDILK